jgi:hypothetical protein
MDQLSAATLRTLPLPDIVTGAPSPRHRRRALRLRGRHVETVVSVFEAPDTGRRLTLVGLLT